MPDDLSADDIQRMRDYLLIAHEREPLMLSRIHALCDMAARALRPEAVWIECSEREPKEDDYPVVCLDSEGQPFTASSHASLTCYNATCWMPLPSHGPQSRSDAAHKEKP